MCVNADCSYCGDYCPMVEHPNCCTFSCNIFSHDAINNSIIKKCINSIISNNSHLHKNGCNINIDQELSTNVCKFTVEFILNKSDYDKMYEDEVSKLKEQYNLKNRGDN